MKTRGEKKIPTAKEAYLRLEGLCARAERCTAELRRKLFQWGVPSGEHDSIIDLLIDRRFVDDARFAGAFVRDKVTFERRGRLYLKRELMARRIPGDVIERVISDIDEQEYINNLDTLMERKMRQNPELSQTFEGRTKIFRYGVQKGFEPGLVSSRLKNLLAKENG